MCNAYELQKKRYVFRGYVKQFLHQPEGNVFKNWWMTKNGQIQSSLNICEYPTRAKTVQKVLKHIVNVDHKTAIFSTS